MRCILSRRKDRERILSARRANPDYTGFRGYDQEPSRTGDTPMAAAVCSVCKRKRNVPVGIAMEQGDAFVCQSCQEEAAAAAEGEAAAEGAAVGAGEEDAEDRPDPAST